MLWGAWFGFATAKRVSDDALNSLEFWTFGLAAFAGCAFIFLDRSHAKPSKRDPLDPKTFFGRDRGTSAIHPVLAAQQRFRIHQNQPVRL